MQFHLNGFQTGNPEENNGKNSIRNPPRMRNLTEKADSSRQDKVISDK